MGRVGVGTRHRSRGEVGTDIQLLFARAVLNRAISLTSIGRNMCERDRARTVYAAAKQTANFTQVIRAAGFSCSAAISGSARILKINKLFVSFAMSLRYVFAVLALAGATLAGPEVTELKVESLSVPEGCTTKSKNGDMLTMHYTGTLDDGHKFDSRYVCVTKIFTSHCKTSFLKYRLYLQTVLRCVLLSTLSCLSLYKRLLKCFSNFEVTVTSIDSSSCVEILLAPRMLRINIDREIPVEISH